MNDLDKLNAVGKILEAGFGFTANEAKMVAYWCLSTHGISKLTVMPGLVILGSAGTGKTTLLEVIGKLSHRSLPIVNGKHTTQAQLRDELEFESTALIDEADAFDEDVLIRRFSRSSSQQRVKRQGRTGWMAEELDLFGPVALHRRRPFADLATFSRALLLNKRKATNYRSLSKEELAGASRWLEEVSCNIPWANAKTGSGRVADAWSPLIIASETLADAEWLGWAVVEIERAENAVEQGQEDEPVQRTFKAFLSLAIGPNRKLKDRVVIADVVRALNDEGDTANGWQVGQVLRDLGLDTFTRGGKAVVRVPMLEDVAAIADYLGIEDDWLTEAMKAA